MRRVLGTVFALTAAVRRVVWGGVSLQAGRGALCGGVGSRRGSSNRAVLLSGAGGAGAGAKE